MMKDWNRFLNLLGKRTLRILNHQFPKFIYDLPKPGGIIVNDSLYANSAFPGLNIKYTLDGTTPNSNSKNYVTPLKINQSESVHLRLFDNNGRGGNTIMVNK
mgnify:CR=1 FL=1